ncbi:four-carbon acid sugar kinase family protein [Thermoanaerobacteraceae bacterium SP2]|nr:four-carbon acid sugar kinase family protein [Thermoanaerobacteraceae bacterium SP2]
MEKLCIIADDLTGATDTGVQFSKFGISTAVVFNYLTIKDLTFDFDIVSINAGTRNINREVAYSRVKDIVRTLRDMNFKLYYKKIDSTLRGQPDVEIEAMMDEMGYEMAFIVPSFPANGRKVEKGYLYIDKNLKEEQSNFQSIGFVPDIFKNKTTKMVSLIEIDEVRKGSCNIKQKIEEMRNLKKQIFVIDAVTNDDLMNIAFAVKDYAYKSVIAGSAGLAACIPLTWEMVKENHQYPRGKPILFLAGTRNMVTAEQIKTLTAFSSVKVVEMNSEKIIKGKNEEEINRVIDETRKALNEGKITVIAIDSLLKSQVETYSQEIPSEKAQKIAKSFGIIAKAIVTDNMIYTMIVTGGDIAINVFDALGAKGIILENEVLPGIPAGRLIGGGFEGLHVVTKAGGFGDKNSFIDIVNYLKSATEGEKLK